MTAFKKEQVHFPPWDPYKWVWTELSFLYKQVEGRDTGKGTKVTFSLFIALIRLLSLPFGLPSLRPLRSLAADPGPFTGNKQSSHLG